MSAPTRRCSGAIGCRGCCGRGAGAASGCESHLSADPCPHCPPSPASLQGGLPSTPPPSPSHSPVPGLRATPPCPQCEEPLRGAGYPGFSEVLAQHKGAGQAAASPVKGCHPIKFQRGISRTGSVAKARTPGSCTLPVSCPPPWPSPFLSGEALGSQILQPPPTPGPAPPASPSVSLLCGGDRDTESRDLGWGGLAQEESGGRGRSLTVSGAEKCC